MDPQKVKDRLLRLNEEIHDERYAGADLKQVIQLWDQAKASFHKADYVMAEDLIDRAYARLHAPTAVATVPQPQAQSQEIQFFQVEEYETRMDKALSAAVKFINMSAWTMFRPARIFSLFMNMNPIPEATAYFILFGAITAALGLAIIGVGDTDMDVVKAATALLLSGFFFCIVASYVTHRILRSLGGRSTLNKTVAVCGFSLSPIILSGCVLTYIVYGTTLLRFEGKELAEVMLGAILAATIALVGAIWTLSLQTIGLNIVHNCEKDKCGMSVVFANLITLFAFLATATVVWLLGGADWLL